MTEEVVPVVEILRSWQEMAPYRPFLAEAGWFPEADAACLEFESGLIFLVCRQGGEIRGVLAAKLEETEMEWRLGTKTVGHSRVHQLNVDYGRVWGELDDAAARALVDGIRQLFRSSGADVARFGYIPEGGALDRQLHKSSFVFCDHFPLKNRRWRRTLPPKYEDLLREHSKNTRRKVKVVQNRLQKAGVVECRCFTQPEDLEQALRDLRQIDQASYQCKIGAGFDPSELAMKKLRWLCDHGMSRIYLLYLDGRPLAFYQGYLYKGTYWGSYTGFDDEFRHLSAGTAVFHHVLEDLCGLGGVKMIEFGLGDSGYKEVYASEHAMHVETLLFRRSWRGVQLMVLRAFTGAVRTIAYALLERTGLLKWLKTRWRRKAMMEESVAGDDATAVTH
ncbi:GNAT family N-acetyltransferase [Paludibaculum fermentans]|uniref:GNAT family N-acetyltransferase n=1 Tax=Paludibaculum fermentans TaxID=1473598 RepID=UPI003EB7A76E